KREFQADSITIAPFSDRIARTPCLLLAAKSVLVEQTFLACNLALELARQGLSVGIVETVTIVPSAFFLLGSHFPASIDTEGTTSPTFSVLGTPKIIVVAIPGYKKIKAVLLGKDFDSTDCLTTVNSLARDCHFLIINARSDIFKHKKWIYPTNPFFILPVMVNSQASIETDAMIKQISETVACPEIGLLMIEESRSHKAEVTFNAIAKKARGILSADIHFMGTIPRGTDFARPILARTPVLLEAGNAPVFRSIRKLTRIIHKHFSSSQITN
ncbi:MAG: hypothetical protein JRE23_16355, partial [Deltaproteobacteria bacterium]|nr:hypothetical protein [Deltaproteobacteria bacterium]